MSLSINTTAWYTFGDVMLTLLRRVLGSRFDVWLGLVCTGLAVYAIIAIISIFANKGVGRILPFSLFFTFSGSSFLILIPFGYLVEHAKEAAALRFIGWIYSLYILGGFLIMGYGIWLIGSWCVAGKLSGLEIVLQGLIAFAMLSIYTGFATPLAILLAIIRKYSSQNQ